MKREFDIKDYLRMLIKWRRVIAFNVAVITLLTIVISLLLPQKWTAVTTILPPTEETSIMGISGFYGGGLEGLLGGGGLSRMLPGMATPSDLFAKELESRRIMIGVIRQNDLQDLFKKKLIDDAVKRLKEITTIEVSPEGILSVCVTERTPELASLIANSFVTELDRFNRDVNMTIGKRNRLFLEERLETVKKDLRAAEESLKVFQERHKTVSLPDEMNAAIRTVSDIKAQIIANEIKLGMLYKYSSKSSPEIIRLQSELTQLKKKEREFESARKGNEGFGAGFSIPFSELPEIILKFARRERDLVIQEAVYELITQQYEQAKIMEVRDTPTVQVLDKATPPERRSFPKRRKMVEVAFVLSFLVGIGLTFLFEYIERIAGKKEVEEWITMGKVIKGDFMAIRNRIKRSKDQKR